MSTVAQRRADEAEQSARLVISPPTEGMQPHNAVLASLPTDDARAFRELARPIPLLRGAALHRAGETPTRLYFIEQGLVSHRVDLGSGREIETHTVGPEGVVGMVEALGGGGATATAHVSVPGLAWAISPAAYLSLDLRAPLFMEAVARHLAAAFDELQQGIACRAVHGVDQRLSRWLLERQGRLGGAAGVPVTHACLASGLGVQRTSVTEAVQRLQSRGLILSGRGAVTITDQGGLEDHSCGCRSALQARRSRRQAA